MELARNRGNSEAKQHFSAVEHSRAAINSAKDSVRKTQAANSTLLKKIPVLLYRNEPALKPQLPETTHSSTATPYQGLRQMGHQETVVFLVALANQQKKTRIRIHIIYATDTDHTTKNNTAKKRNKKNGKERSQASRFCLACHQTSRVL